MAFSYLLISEAFAKRRNLGFLICVKKARKGELSTSGKVSLMSHSVVDTTCAMCKTSEVIRNLRLLSLERADDENCNR
jgi:hypothetical protein